MKKELIGILVCIMLVGIVLPVNGNLIVHNQTALLINGNTLYVGGDGPGNYTKIQDAIDNASDSDTVFVYDDLSPYNESCSINKVIKLIGENKCSTIILNNGISLVASGVTVTGFTLENTGIHIQNNSNIIYNNNFISYGYLMGWGGIFLSRSSYNTIYNNSFFNCGITTIELEFENYIYNNIVNGKRLIYLYASSDKIFEDIGQVIIHSCNNITIKNSIFSNLLMGIEIYDSNNCHISENYFMDILFFSIIILDSQHNIITRNYFSDDFNPNIGGGLGLINCTDNTIFRNVINNAMVNIALGKSSDNNFKQNNFYFQKRMINIFSTESVNNWEGNFWNRPRILPFFIWNFNPSRIIPSFDIDRRPALSPYNIYHISNYKTSENVEIYKFKIQSNNNYWDYFDSLIVIPKNFGLFKDLLDIWKVLN